MEHNNEIEIGNLSSYIYKRASEIFIAYMDFLKRENTFDEAIFNFYYNDLVDCLDDLEKSTEDYIKRCNRDVIFSKLRRIFLNDQKSLPAMDKLAPQYIASFKKDLVLIDSVDTYLSKITFSNNDQDLSDVYLILSFIAVEQSERYEKYLDQFEYYYDLHDQIPPTFRLSDFTRSDLMDFTNSYVKGAILKKV